MNSPVLWLSALEYTGVAVKSLEQIKLIWR